MPDWIEEWYERDPTSIYAVDEEGKPTTWMSFRVLKEMFYNRGRTYTPREMAETLFPSTGLESSRHTNEISDVNIIFRQLRGIIFITEEPPVSGRYKYHLRCPHVDMQAGFERFLVEVEMKGFPRYLLLEDSPSRYRGF